MARTSVADVLDIMDTDLTASEVVPFLTLANAFVDDRLDGKGIGSTLLTEIEKWLTAHFATVGKDRQVESVRVEGTREDYPDLGTGLEATTYGRTAIDLDPTDTLKNIGSGATDLTYRAGGR